MTSTIVDNVANIELGSCTNRALTGTNAECGFLSVPLDYAYPHGAKIQLALSRIKHLVSNEKFQGVISSTVGRVI
jgi:hypothetical protein